MRAEEDMNPFGIEQRPPDESIIALGRILPRVLAAVPLQADRALFEARAKQHFPAAFEMFLRLYGHRYDCHYHLEQTMLVAAEYFAARPADMRSRDHQRLSDPVWFTSNREVGAVCYVDLFAENLQGLSQKLPYLRELGITYLHLMPLFRAPEPNSDGGYAVSSFREVNPKLGTMEELTALAQEFRRSGISLVFDFVFNHTSDEHDWAKRALADDATYQAYYRMFDDRQIPDAYERHLRDIFPDQAPGSFTFRPEINKWVWTTFNQFQWDLNYANPDVFRAMLGEMLYLANHGADVLRLDAVPFIWKEMGTSCENLPQAHWIIQGFNAFVRIAAPALLFKSEAIVHPRDVRSYISPEECQLSYNPILMSHLWDALATRETYLMRTAMENRFSLPEGSVWLNYVRSHDDIGWGFADEDAAAVGIKGSDHRQFLNEFYIGKFPGSFAAGVPFNYNPRTGDMRVSGTTAALAGLEVAIRLGDPEAIEAALRRISLIYSVVMSIGGIPLLYLGDELATLNDYDYASDPSKAADSRWVHRPAFPAQRAANRHDPASPEGTVFLRLKEMIATRKSLSALAGAETRFVDVHNKHIFAYVRSEKILVLANFSEFSQTVALSDVRRPFGFQAEYLTDYLTGRAISVDGEAPLHLAAYEVLWLGNPD